jgi:uncharacterized protein (DUF1778 family)
MTFHLLTFALCPLIFFCGSPALCYLLRVTLTPSGLPSILCHDIVCHLWYDGRWNRQQGRKMQNTETRNEKLDLRLTPSAKRALRSAARAAHRSVSEFVLESALARAAETLPDRQRFGLNAEQWKAFQAALSAPPRRAPRLARLLKEPSVFERGSV